MGTAQIQTMNHPEVPSLCQGASGCLDAAGLLDLIHHMLSTMSLFTLLFCFALFLIEAIVKRFCFLSLQNRVDPLSLQLYLQTGFPSDD